MLCRDTCFQKFATDNLERLRGLPESELLTEFKGLKINLRQGFVSPGMGDLQQKLLTVEEAKKRKAEQICQAKKRQSCDKWSSPRQYNDLRDSHCNIAKDTPANPHLMQLLELSFALLVLLCLEGVVAWLSISMPLQQLPVDGADTVLVVAARLRQGR